MITVTKVRISPDLKAAKAYLSLFNTSDQVLTLDDIEGRRSDIRRRLGNELKNQLRHVPEIHFFLDDSLDYAAKIDDLLNKDSREK